MIAGLLLAGYAAVAGWAAPGVLGRSWAARAPRLALGLWLALAVSWVAACALALLSLAAPVLLSWPAGTGQQTILLAPGMPAGAAIAGTGVVAGLALVTWPAGCVLAEFARCRAGWRTRSAFLAVAGRPDPDLGVTVLAGDEPAAWCLPGRRRSVVISAGALAVLSRGQLAAVLAHEQAHLRGRHHLMLAAARGLSRAFPRVPLLARASPQAALLAEMAADDAASRGREPAELAAALVVLARAGAQHAVLAAGGAAAIARIDRLLAPPPRPGRPAHAARLAAAAAALCISAVIACLPLIAVACDVITRP